ncbi:MAG TPA: hypothetical protein VGK63_08050, partial [Candidatus Limnocylindrales bacterium]
MHGTLTHPTKPPEPIFAPELRFAPPTAPAAPVRVPAGGPTLRAAEPGVAPIPVAVVGATGYAGGEAVRLLARHPGVRIVGIVGRDAHGEALAERQAHLAGAGLTLEPEIPSEAAAVFLALPHSAAAAIVPSIVERGTAVVDLGPDFRLHDPADYPT